MLKCSRQRVDLTSGISRAAASVLLARREAVELSLVPLLSDRHDARCLSCLKLESAYDYLKW